MNIFTAILDCLSIGYVEALKNLSKSACEMDDGR